jgi:predicted DNA-binding transcriptional regulator AlpA
MMSSHNYANGQVWFTTKQVAARFKVSVPTIWRWVSNGRFPKPVTITARACRWSESALFEFEKDVARRNNGNQKIEGIR